METCLSFEEITSVDSIDQLLGLYAEKGQTFSNDRQFFRRIQADWQSERVRVRNVMGRRKISSGLPKELPSIDVTVDSSSYRLYGVIHSFASGIFYKALVWYTVEQAENWFFEQDLRAFFPEISKGIEVLDTSIHSSDYCFRAGLSESLKQPIEYLKRIKDRWSITPKKDDTPQQIAPNDSFITKMLSSYLFINPGVVGMPDSRRKVEIIHTLSFFYPLESWSYKLPAYVDIQCREQNKKRYTPAQRRSAYQAEFLKQLPVNEDKRMITGAHHSSQIKYFLLHGVKDNEIIDTAGEHVELLQRDPEGYQLLKQQVTADFKRHYLKGQRIGNICLGLAIGIPIGALSIIIY